MRRTVKGKSESHFENAFEQERTHAISRKEPYQRAESTSVIITGVPDTTSTTTTETISKFVIPDTTISPLRNLSLGNMPDATIKDFGKDSEFSVYVSTGESTNNDFRLRFLNSSNNQLSFTEAACYQYKLAYFYEFLKVRKDGQSPMFFMADFLKEEADKINANVIEHTLLARIWFDKIMTEQFKTNGFIFISALCILLDFPNDDNGFNKLSNGSKFLAFLTASELTIFRRNLSLRYFKFSEHEERHPFFNSLENIMNETFGGFLASKDLWEHKFVSAINRSGNEYSKTFIVLMFMLTIKIRNPDSIEECKNDVEMLKKQLGVNSLGSHIIKEHVKIEPQTGELKNVKSMYSAAFEIFDDKKEWTIPYEKLVFKNSATDHDPDPEMFEFFCWMFYNVEQLVLGKKETPLLKTPYTLSTIGSLFIPEKFLCDKLFPVKIDY